MTSNPLIYDGRAGTGMSISPEPTPTGEAARDAPIVAAPRADDHRTRVSASIEAVSRISIPTPFP
jgi:hypothetical protein